MTHATSFAPGKPAAAVALAGALLIAGCASTRIDGQWTDPQLGSTSLRGASVYVACEAAEPVVQQVCQERMTAELGTLGAAPLTGSAATPAQTLDAARAAGAKAVLNVTLAPDVAVADSGMSVGLGIGGFGSRSFGGVGISAPVGAMRVKRGYVANSTLTDVASGRVMWTAKASADASDDVNSQVTELARVTGEAARKTGLF